MKTKWADDDMKSVRNMQYILWGLSVVVFGLPWLILIPWVARWSIAGIGYVIGAFIWAIALLMYAKWRPDQPDEAWSKLRKQFRTLLIVHLALIPIFWIGQGLYLYTQFDQRMTEWKQSAEQQISELTSKFNETKLNRSNSSESNLNKSNANEMEMMKEQIRPLLMLRAAIGDPKMNDFRWIIQEKLGSNLEGIHDQIGAEVEKLNALKDRKQDFENRVEADFRKQVEAEIRKKMDER